MPLLKEEGVLAPMLTWAAKIMGCLSRRAQESADSGMKKLRPKTGRRAQESADSGMKKLRPKTGRRAQECAVHGSPVTATLARCGPTSSVTRESASICIRERG
jgi:hypothetical protein